MRVSDKQQERKKERERAGERERERHTNIGSYKWLGCLLENSKEQSKIGITAPINQAHLE